ncbi:MAG: PHP-associated domain-containing protein [Chloroflexota bacterium]
MKLDLHTHCYEATMYARPSVEVVRRIVDRVKDKGLDGIGITDHDGKEYAYQVLRIYEQHFDHDIVLIPGQEVKQGPLDVVELCLPEGCTFRFLAHPPSYSYRWEEHLDGLHGVEVENGNWALDRERVQAAADRYGLMLLRNSDAHSLWDIGRYHNEVTLEELCACVGRQG